MVTTLDLTQSNLSDNQIETCPDYHHCFHGSKCVQNPYDEGSYYCDCDEVVFEARYEGLRCEHKADIYCVAEGASKHSFCTNKGECVEIVGPEEAHVGCKCPSGYEGTHCQFVKGTKPKDWPFTSQQTNDSAQNKGSIAGEIVVVLVLLIVAGVVGVAFFYKRYYSREKYGDTFSQSELELQVEGKSMIGTTEPSPKNASQAAAATGENLIV